MVSSSSKTRVACSPRWTVRCFLWAITFARNSLRDFAYASRVKRESRDSLDMAGISLIGKAVSHSQQGDGVFQLGLPGRLHGPESFLDVVGGELAVGGEVVGREIGDLPEHRAPDLQRRGMELLLHAPGAGVPRAALDRQHLGAVNRFERRLGLQAHLLHARMAGDVIGALAPHILEPDLEHY